jgi:hypothetical protein
MRRHVAAKAMAMAANQKRRRWQNMAKSAAAKARLRLSKAEGSCNQVISINSG